MSMSLTELVSDFACAMERVDAAAPRAVNARSGAPFQPGLGPHTEAQTVAMVMDELVRTGPTAYRSHQQGVPYPRMPRQRCDLCVGTPPSWEWAIEIKMIRMLGDNGKPNDNLPTHILSPYPSHRSALTDCEKLRSADLGQRKAILIYGYDYAEYPVDALLDAFETLARQRVKLSERVSASFGGLIHPVHREGTVSAWELEQGD